MRSFATMSRCTAAAALLILAACGPKQDDDRDHEELPEPREVSTPPAAGGAAPAGGTTAPQLAGPREGAGAPKHVWSRKIGGAGADAARAIAVADDGGYVITGYFEDGADFGAGAVAAKGGKDVFIARYDSAGTLAWVKAFGGEAEDIGQAIALDSQGNIVVTGTFTDSADFGGGKPFESKGRTDIFIARYSPTGDHLWSRRAGGEVEDRGYAVAIDSKDNVIVTGYFGAAISLGGEPLGSAGQADIFVAKYAPSSEHQWSWRIGGKVDDLGRAIAVDAEDNIVLAGDFHETITLGGRDMVSSGNADVLLAKFTPSGEHLWSRSFGSFFHDFSVGVAVDARGDIALTGSFEQKVDFGGGGLEGGQKKEIFLARYTGAGEHLWSKHFGGRDDDVGSAVAFDAYGNVFMAGWFWRDVDFGGGKLSSKGDNDVVLAQYAPDGSYVSAQRFGDIGADFGRALAVDGDGKVVLVGTFRGKVSFGGDELVYSGEAKNPHGDAFIAKLAP